MPSCSPKDFTLRSHQLLNSTDSIYATSAFYPSHSSCHWLSCLHLLPGLFNSHLAGFSDFSHLLVLRHPLCPSYLRDFLKCIGHFGLLLLKNHWWPSFNTESSLYTLVWDSMTSLIRVLVNRKPSMWLLKDINRLSPSLLHCSALWERRCSPGYINAISTRYGYAHTIFPDCNMYSLCDRNSSEPCLPNTQPCAMLGWEVG